MERLSTLEIAELLRPYKLSELPGLAVKLGVSHSTVLRARYRPEENFTIDTITKLSKIKELKC